MQFEMILEGARQLDVARTNLSAAEQKETKVSTCWLKNGVFKVEEPEYHEINNQVLE